MWTSSTALLSAIGLSPCVPPDAAKRLHQLASLLKCTWMRGSSVNWPHLMQQTASAWAGFSSDIRKMNWTAHGLSPKRRCPTCCSRLPAPGFRCWLTSSWTTLRRLQRWAAAAIRNVANTSVVTMSHSPNTCQRNSNHARGCKEGMRRRTSSGRQGNKAAWQHMPSRAVVRQPLLAKLLPAVSTAA